MLITVPMGNATLEFSGIFNVPAVEPLDNSKMQSLWVRTSVVELDENVGVTAFNVDPANSIESVPSPTYSLSAVESKDILPAAVDGVLESDSVGVVIVAEVKVLFEIVTELVSVISGAAHSIPYVAAELTVKTWPFEFPTLRFTGVSAADAVIKDPLAPSVDGAIPGSIASMSS